MEEGPDWDLVEVFGWVEAACPGLRQGLQSNHSPTVLEGGVHPFPANTKSVQTLPHSGERRVLEEESPEQDQDIVWLPHSPQLPQVPIRD